MRKYLTSRAFLVNIFVFLFTISVVYLTPARYAFIDPPTIKDVDPVTFYKEYKNNPDKFMFIDVRQLDAYNKQHAEGSVSLPLQNLYFERFNLPKNNGKIIALICSQGIASGVGYSYLQHYGFRNIQRVSGGIEGWIAAGLPTSGYLVLPKQIKTSLNTLDCSGNPVSAQS